MRIDQAIIMRFSYIGEQFVINARNNATFTDVTGNLRSSIGYIVLKNGRQVAISGFDTVKEGSKGTKEGKAYIRRLKAQYPTGYVLIVVAGMEYAAAVEARGKDVLTASSIIAQNQLKDAIKAIKRNINNR